MNQSVWVASITPFADDLSIDWDSWQGLLRRFDQAKLGVVLLGSTGEGLALSEEERCQTVEWAQDLGLSTPLMVGVGGFQLSAQIRWMQWCQGRGIRRFLLSPPLYAKPGPQGQAHWFSSLLDAAEGPCLVYNHPGRSGIRLHPKALQAISGHRHFAGVKDAGGDLACTGELMRAAPNARFFAGEDDQLRGYVQLGATGLISVCGNAWPEETLRYFIDCQSPSEDVGLFVEACEALCCATNPIPVKALLQKKGWIGSAAVRPPLSLKDLPVDNRLAELDECVSRSTERGAVPSR